jgi:hypothetical protein
MREPCDWLFSCYRHFVRYNMAFRHDNSIGTSISFVDYLRILIELGDSKPTQAYMILDQQGTVILKSIGRFTEINKYYLRLCNHLNIKPLSLPQLNVDPGHFKLSDTISSAERALVEKYWSLDWSIWEQLESSETLDFNGYNCLTFDPPAIDLASYDPWSYMYKSP